MFFRVIFSCVNYNYGFFSIFSHVFLYIAPLFLLSCTLLLFSFVRVFSLSYFPMFYEFTVFLFFLFFFALFSVYFFLFCIHLMFLMFFQLIISWFESFFVGSILL